MKRGSGRVCSGKIALAQGKWAAQVICVVRSPSAARTDVFWIRGEHLDFLNVKTVGIFGQLAHLVGGNVAAITPTAAGTTTIVCHVWSDDMMVDKTI